MFLFAFVRAGIRYTGLRIGRDAGDLPESSNMNPEHRTEGKVPDPEEVQSGRRPEVNKNG